MIIIRKGISTATYTYRLITGSRAVPITPGRRQELKAQGVKVAALPNADFDRIAKDLG